ncbi:MAG: type I-E CRISPR-associated protein Cse1/CasA [Leptospirales bacterium]
MSNEKRFNLIDEPWIPVADVGRVSLKQLFSRPEYRALGGNPIQKIALTKLLLAIAQSASTPDNDDDWKMLKPEGLAKKCLSYLERWHDRFFLYGEHPFLQMPAIKRASLQTFGVALAEISTGNTTVLTQSQIERDMTDADKALLIVQLMGFGLGGKADNTVVLSLSYRGKSNEKGKPSVSKSGAFVGYPGYLHSFLQGQSLLETLWLNLFTRQQISDLRIFPGDIGVSPWEQMPEGEICPVAEALKSSLMGRLVPVSSFCLLEENGLHYSEGIAHPGYKEGGIDPSVAVDYSAKIPKALWIDPEKRPWRSLPALLSFFAQTDNKGFDCYQLRLNMPRAVSHLQTIGIWSGGLRVSRNSGKVFISVSDDFVESLVQIKSDELSDWFPSLKLEMGEMDKLSQKLKWSVLNYFKDQKMKNDKQAAQSSNLFWQLCERRFQDLVNNCKSPEQVKKLRSDFAGFVYKVYDTSCPKETARQIDAWAHNRPKLHSYLDFAKERS